MHTEKPVDITTIADHAKRLASETYEARAKYGCDAGEGAASAAISVAVTNSVELGHTAAFHVLIRSFRKHGQGGPEAARFALDTFDYDAPARVRISARMNRIADVLDACGVDLLDEGRTVRELRAYAATMSKGA